MKNWITYLVCVGLLAAGTKKQVVTSKHTIIQLNAGIITPYLKESKKFYQEVLYCSTIFESDWYVLLATPDGNDRLGFLQPDHPSQQLLFQPAFAGKGIFLTVEVDNVDAEYKRINGLGIPITVKLREEPWGDRHFAITDPNGIGVDIVTYTKPE